MTYEQAYKVATEVVYIYMTYGDLLDEADKRNWKSKTRSVIERRLIKTLVKEYMESDNSRKVENK